MRYALAMVTPWQGYNHLSEENGSLFKDCHHRNLAHVNVHQRVFLYYARRLVIVNENGGAVRGYT